MKSIPSSGRWQSSSAKDNEFLAAESISALARGLQRAQGFTLFVAVCNKPRECEQLTRMLEEAMPAVGFHHVRVSPTTTDLLAEVLAQVPDMTGPILITDIDRAIQGDSPKHSILETLNLQRPDWAKRVNQAVVLWTPELLLPLIGREAPDFLDWRSDTIHFPDLSDEQVELVREIALPWEAASKSLKAREERADELKQRLAETSQNPDRVAMAARGVWLLELTADSASLGRREEALKAAQGALDIYRELVKDRPDAFLPDLAGSLNNLGNTLSELGRREEALQTAQKALDIYRRLAKDRPDAFLPDLAGSLNNLGNTLSELGRREEALKAAQEALDIYRRLAKDRPDAFLPDLARSLNNLGNMLSGLGRREEALKTAQEALHVYRELVKDRPDAFSPDLAGSLNNLGNRLSDLGRREEALKAAQESLDIRRQLAKDRPNVFLPDLATSLGTLGTCLAADARPGEAVEAFAAGVRALSSPFSRLPVAFAPLMRSLVSHYLRHLEELGESADMGLLGPILAKFEEMKNAEGGLSEK
jgi:tetratricopeptide (TPR) repeat protein